MKNRTLLTAPMVSYTENDFPQISWVSGVWETETYGTDADCSHAWRIRGLCESYIRLI